MRHPLGASLNIRHHLSSSKGPEPLHIKLLTTYIPKTSAFTLAFSASQRRRTASASARTSVTLTGCITLSAGKFCFFFSSRRRHTRCSRDWSSDVCSSDLALQAGPQRVGEDPGSEAVAGRAGGTQEIGRGGEGDDGRSQPATALQ